MLQSPEEPCVFGVLSSSRFRPTNIKVLSLLFTEYPFSLPWHAGHIFDRFHVLSVFIEGGNSWKMQWDESTFVPISCSTFTRPGYVASKFCNSGDVTKPSALACTCWWSFRPLNNSQPEETDKMCRNINNQTGTLYVSGFFLLPFAKLFKQVKLTFSS